MNETLIPVYKAGAIIAYAKIDTDDLPIIAGYKFRLDKEGYVIGNRGKRPPKALHRLVMREPDGIVDHRFGVLTDCRKSQLRITDSFGNGQNRVKLSRNNKSGYRGVSWKQRDQKWEARVEHRGKTYFGGYFSDLLSAKHAASEIRKALGFLSNDSDTGVIP